MARRVIAYVGEGRRRRAVYADEGPARAHGATLGTLAPTMPDRILVGAMFASGAGKVERRQITDDERAVRASRDAAPSLLARAPGVRSTAADIAASRARGAARAGFVAGVTKPYLLSRTPEPVTPAVPPPLREEIHVVEPVAATPSPELRLPCPVCVKADVCAIRPTLVADELVVVAPLRDGVRVAEITVSCGFFVAATRDATTRVGSAVAASAQRPARPSRGAAAERGSRSPEEIEARDTRAAKVLDLLDQYNGNTKRVGLELGLRGNVVANIARTARLRAEKAATA